MTIKKRLRRSWNLKKKRLREKFFLMFKRDSNIGSGSVGSDVFVKESDVYITGSVILRKSDYSLVDHYYWIKRWALLELRCRDFIRTTLSIFFSTRVKEVDRAFVFYHPLKGNYYHFVYEFLTKTCYIREILANNQDMLIVAPGFSSLSHWQRAYIELLGYDMNAILTTSKTVKIREAILLEKGTLMNNGDKEAVVCFRDEILEKTNHLPAPTLPQFFIVSRAQAQQRRVENESALVDDLKCFGFQLVKLENLSVFEQVQLFARAKIVIAPHGAGNVNLIYSQAECLLIELRRLNTTFDEKYYERMCSMIGSRYKAVYSSDVNSKGGSFSVDIETIRQIVEQEIADEAKR